MRESKIESWYVDELEMLGVECLKLHKKGWPDRQCFGFNERTCFIEFKRTGVDVDDPHQVERIRDLRRRGFQVFEINEKSRALLKVILVCLGIQSGN